MSTVTQYVCDVCGNRIAVDARVMLGLTVTVAFNAPALDAPHFEPQTKHVCPACYATATIAQVAGVAPEDARFYLV